MTQRGKPTLFCKFNVEMRALNALKPNPRNARHHPKRQIEQLKASMKSFGFTNPLLVSPDGDVIAGNGRLVAARQLGMTEVPVIPLPNLSADQRRALALADNKIALNAVWDMELLASELQVLIDIGFDLEITGFSLAESEVVLDGAADSDPAGKERPEDGVPTISGPAVTRCGDVWELGRHRLLCGDARVERDFVTLMQGKRADLLFTDPPYNVKIDGNVSGLGAVKHREFAFASGEMSQEQFTRFLTITLSNCAGVMRDGAIAYASMDWRHTREMLAAGREAFTELKNLVVWNKTNGGMGTFYRSKHELIFVFKVGTAPLWIPTKPPPRSEKIAPLHSEMMSPPR